MRKEAILKEGKKARISSLAGEAKHLPRTRKALSKLGFGAFGLGSEKYEGSISQWSEAAIGDEMKGMEGKNVDDHHGALLFSGNPLTQQAGGRTLAGSDTIGQISPEFLSANEGKFRKMYDSLDGNVRGDWDRLTDPQKMTEAKRVINKRMITGAASDIKNIALPMAKTTGITPLLDAAEHPGDYGLGTTQANQIKLVAESKIKRMDGSVLAGMNSEAMEKIFAHNMGTAAAPLFGFDYLNRAGAVYETLTSDAINASPRVKKGIAQSIGVGAHPGLLRDAEGNAHGITVNPNHSFQIT